jgi:hypothetical protein
MAGSTRPSALSSRPAARGPCRCGAGAQQAFGGDRGQAGHQIRNPDHPRRRAFGDYYISHDLTPGQREKVETLLVALLKAHPQVANVFTKDEIARTPLPAANPQDWTMRERARASFDPSGPAMSM